MAEELNLNNQSLDKLLQGLGLDMKGGAKSDKKAYKLVKMNGKKFVAGHYVGKVPGEAAKKAFTRVCRENKALKKDYTATFTIREIKQGGDKKEFRYKGTSSKLKKPIPASKSPWGIAITHERSVKRLK